MSFWRSVGSFLASALSNTSSCDDSDNSSWHQYDNSINPGTGLPTTGGPGTPDVGGNMWGSGYDSGSSFGTGSMFDD